MSFITRKVFKDFIGIEDSNSIDIPDIVRKLNIRINNGLIKLSANVSAFFMLENFMLKESDITENYVIQKVSVITNPFPIVRVLTSNGIIFQFNCPNGELNDMMLFVPKTLALEEFYNKTTSYVKVNDVNFTLVMEARFQATFVTLKKEVEFSAEKLYSRDVKSFSGSETMVEYFLEKIVDSKVTNYIGVVINENDIKII